MTIMQKLFGGSALADINPDDLYLTRVRDLADGQEFDPKDCIDICSFAGRTGKHLRDDVQLLLDRREAEGVVRGAKNLELQSVIDEAVKARFIEAARFEEAKTAIEHAQAEFIEAEKALQRASGKEQQAKTTKRKSLSDASSLLHRTARAELREATDYDTPGVSRQDSMEACYDANSFEPTE